MFGNARRHQIGELSGQLTYGQGTAFCKQIEDKPTRRVGQNPEQSVAIARQIQRSQDLPGDREFDVGRRRAHNPAPSQPSPNGLCLQIHRE